MRSKIYLSVLTLIISHGALASTAGLFVEPMITYEQGRATTNMPSPFGTSKSNIDGFGLGARLGFHVLETVFVGVDGRYSRPNFTNSDTGINTQATAYNYGPVIGVQLPTPLSIRVWGGYILGGAMDLERDRGVDLKFKDADGYRVGAGIKLLAVSLNLEYQDMTYAKTELQDAGIFTGSTNSVTQRNSSYILSVSFPISL